MTGSIRGYLGGPDRLTALTRSRDAWLTGAIGELRRLPFVTGAFLVGSLAAGLADPSSDIDLIVVVDDSTPVPIFTDPAAGLGLGGTVLYVRPKARNSPAGGAYRALCLELGGLPMLADVYLWPAATAAVPTGAKVLLEKTALARNDLAFMPLLDRYRTADTTGADPQATASIMMLISLAAKYHARADTSRLAAIASQLGLPPSPDALLLRQTLHQRIDPGGNPQLENTITAIGELLTLADEHRRALGGVRTEGETG